MNKMPSILNNEEGSIIIVTLLVLVLLTIIGMSATSMSNSELAITANGQLHKMAFYAAESGWQHHYDWLAGEYPSVTEDTTTPDTGQNGDLTPDVSYVVDADFGNPDYEHGWEATQFMGYRYFMTSTGSAPREAESQVMVVARKITKYSQYD